MEGHKIVGLACHVWCVVVEEEGKKGETNGCIFFCLYIHTYLIIFLVLLLDVNPMCACLLVTAAPGAAELAGG